MTLVPPSSAAGPRTVEDLARALDVLALPAWYAAAVDAADWGALGALLADDVVVVSGWGSTAGRAATVDGYRARAATIARQTHWLANQRLVALDAEAGRVLCAFVALVRPSAGAEQGDVVFRGSYDFQLVHQAPDWRIRALTTGYDAPPARLPPWQSGDAFLARLRSAGA